MQNEGILAVTDSDEHSEEGHIIEDAKTRSRMMQKRMRKLAGLKNDIAAPRLYGPKGADTTLIGWGSTYYAICEAVDALTGEGQSVNALHLSELWPFPADDVKNVLDSAHKTIVIENNATGQLSHLIQAETCRKVNDSILKYDGRPFSPSDIVQEVKKRNN